MNFKEEFLFCSKKILKNIDEIDEIYTCISNIQWAPEFHHEQSGKQLMHQTAYNAAFEDEFDKFNWSKKPLLHNEPRLIGDFMKNDIFIEIQFGNSSTIYRDYYKFHYGLMHGLLSLAVLIVPVTPKKFFPTRKESVSNMAEFDFALRYFKLLPIPVPILLVGLLPEN